METEESESKKEGNVMVEAEVAAVQQLALKMENGAMSQEMPAASRSWKWQGNIIP